MDGLEGYYDDDPMDDMGSEENYDSMDGFSIADEATGSYDIDSEIDDNDWLEMNETAAARSAGLKSEMQVGSIQQQSHIMQHAIKGIGSGAILGNTSTGILRINEAKKALGSLSGGDPLAVSNRLRVPAPSPVTTIDPFTMEEISTSAYQIPESTINKAASYLTNTLGETLDRGPGSRLHGQMNESKAKQAEADQMVAYQMIGNLADKLYITDRTKNSDVYGVRRESVVNELTEYLINGDLTGQGGAILPNTNDMMTPGLVPTTGLIGSTGSSPWGRLESDLMLEKHGIPKDADGWHQFNFDNPFDREVAKRVPSIKNTLMPKPRLSKDAPQDERDQAKATQDFEWERVKEDVKFIRDTLRLDGKTERDIDMGNEKRILGLQERDTDWSIASTFRDFHSEQLGMVGLSEYSATSDVSHAMDPENLLGKAIPRHRAGTLKGSGTGGSYGDKEITELQQAVEGSVEAYQRMVAKGYEPDDALRRLTGRKRANQLAQVAPEGSAHEKYLLESAKESSPEQGSTAWREQRAGKVTGSIAPDLYNKGKGDLRVAAKLAEERMVMAMPEGKAKELAKLKLDISNSFTAAGNRFEDKARDTFLSSEEGRGLSFEEAFFVEGRGKYAGMGASPDGRLFNEDGSSAGLLELKFLGEGGMEEALKKYTAQTQFQMMISGEKQTHFFALDKETNEYQHEIIHADAEYQAELQGLASRALLQEAKITNPTELMLMKASYKGARKSSSQPPARTDEGQTSSFSAKADADEPATSFNPAMVGTGPFTPTGKASAQEISSGMISASSNSVTNQMGSIAADLLALDKSDLGDHSAAKSEEAARNKAIDKMRDEANRENQYRTRVEAGKQANYNDMRDEANREQSYRKQVSADEKKASEEMASASKEAAAALTKFKDSAISAATGLAKIGLEGNDTAMDTIRFAANTGMDPDKVRGVELALQSGEGGMTLGMARQNLSAASSIQDKFNNARTVESAITQLAGDWAGNGLNESFGNMPLYNELRGKDPQQILAMVADYQSRTDDPEVKRMIDKTFRTQMAVSKVSGEDLRNANSRINEEGQREFYDGSSWVRIEAQELREAGAASTGEAGGKAAQVLSEADKTSGLWQDIKDMGSYLVGGAAGVTADRVSSSGKGKGKAKGAYAKVAAVGGTAVAASMASPWALPTAGAAAIGIGNYGVWKAGDMIGEGIKDLAGYGYDAIFGEEDSTSAVPDSDMGQAMQQSAPNVTVTPNLITNVNVVTTVDKEGVVTDTNVNDDDYSSEVTKF